MEQLPKNYLNGSNAFNTSRNREISITPEPRAEYK